MDHTFILVKLILNIKYMGTALASRNDILSYKIKKIINIIFCLLYFGHPMVP